MTVTVSIPSIAFKLPKVRRSAPDWRSAPISPITRPTPRETIPRMREAPSKVPTVAKARIMSDK